MLDGQILNICCQETRSAFLKGIYNYYHWLTKTVSGTLRY